MCVFLRFFLVFKQKNTIFAYGIEIFSKVHYIYIYKVETLQGLVKGSSFSYPIPLT